MSIFKLLFSYRGRIRRKPFWLNILLPVFGLSIAIGFIPEPYKFGGVVNIVGYAILTWITTAGFSKRLHDRDHSGWFQLLFFVPAVSLYLLSLVLGSLPWIVALAFAIFLIGLWIFVEAGFSRGTLGHNRFAEDPALYDTSRSKWRPRAKRKSISEQMPDLPNQAAIADDLESEDQMPLPLQSPTFEEQGKDAKALLLDSWLTDDGKVPEILRSTASAFDAPEDDFADDLDEDDPLLGLSNQAATSHEPPQLPPPDLDPKGLWSKDDDTRPKFIPEFNNGPDASPGSGFGFPSHPSSAGRQDGQLTRAANAIASRSVQNPTAPGEARAELSAETDSATATVDQSQVDSDERASINETDQFLEKLRQRATSDPNHARYLQRGAEAGNSWAKLEIAATWLCDSTVSRKQSELAVLYLRELADSRQSYLGAEKEAAYYLGEIYRIGMRYTRPNEDLSVKYFIRASSLGHDGARHSLASQIARSQHQDNEQSLIQPLIESALEDAESSAALLQLIEFDWSITYNESVPIILRTLVDQGNGQAARHLGRMLLDGDDLETATRILGRADQLDNQTTDKIMEIVRAGQAEDNVINTLIDLMQKHAELGDPYAHYQIALAFNNGMGLPQDDLMAFVHINLATARVHGRERDDLIKLREDLKDSLSDEEIFIAQEMVREKFRH
ncbi:MAG: DUF805 domain-containing protein [Rhodospirillales bacterium]